MSRVSLPFVLSILAAGGCAPATTPDPIAVPPQRVVITDADGRNVRSANSAGPVAATIDATPDAAFRAIVAAYGELGIAPDVSDPTARRVARSNLILRRTFANERVSSYFDCGHTLTGARADEGRVTATLGSQAVPGSAMTTITTTVTAIVRPNDGTSTSASNCTSTGRLESRIHELAKVIASERRE